MDDSSFCNRTMGISEVHKNSFDMDCNDIAHEQVYCPTEAEKYCDKASHIYS